MTRKLYLSGLAVGGLALASLAATGATAQTLLSSEPWAPSQTILVPSAPAVETVQMFRPVRAIMPVQTFQPIQTVTTVQPAAEEVITTRRIVAEAPITRRYWARTPARRYWARTPLVRHYWARMAPVVTRTVTTTVVTQPAPIVTHYWARTTPVVTQVMAPVVTQVMAPVVTQTYLTPAPYNLYNPYNTELTTYPW
jgi:hypothetical protein